MQYAVTSSSKSPVTVSKFRVQAWTNLAQTIGSNRTLQRGRCATCGCSKTSCRKAEHNWGALQSRLSPFVSTQLGRPLLNSSCSRARASEQCLSGPHVRNLSCTFSVIIRGMFTREADWIFLHQPCIEWPKAEIKLTLDWLPGSPYPCCH